MVTFTVGSVELCKGILFMKFFNCYAMVLCWIFGGSIFS